MASSSSVTFLCLLGLTCCLSLCSRRAGAEDLDSVSPWNRPEQVTVIASKTIRPHTPYHVMLILANSSQPATFDLKLTSDTQTVTKSALIKPNQSQLVALPINEWSERAGSSFLSFNVKALDKSWQFSQQKQLSHHTNSPLVLIQTSKSVYKPGQTLQFRALFLTPTRQLAPAPLDRRPLVVQVSDPQGNLIKQWKDPLATKGLASFELPLSEDPVLGDWCIKVVVDNKQELEKQFTVAEYLPGAFDVQLSLPSQASYDSTRDITNIAVTVRSSYTYGKPVSGQVTLSVQHVEDGDKLNYSPACRDTADAVKEFRFYQTLADGVADFSVPFQKPNLPMDEEELVAENGACQFQFVASVEEEQTGRKYNSSQRLIIHATDMKIEWLINKGDDPVPFKPGLNYTTMFRVAHQDGSPVAQEFNGLLALVELEYLIHDKRVHSVSLTPASLGLIEHSWQVPQLVEDSNSGQLVVPQSMSIRVTYGGSRVTKQLPRSCSASNQFMQISMVGHSRGSSRRKKRHPNFQQVSVTVGDEMRLRIDAPQPLGPLVSCHATVLGDIVWTYSGESHHKTSMEFDLTISSKMTPALEVLCFYVNQVNKEVIADSLRIPVIGGLSRNFAKINLSQDEAKPGQMISVEVETMPESIIGLLAIEQTSKLPKSNNDLTKEQVENALLGPSHSYQGYDHYHSTAESLFGLSGAIVMTTNMMQPESTYQKVVPSNSRLNEDTLGDMDDEMNGIPAASSADGDEMIAEESGVVESVVLKEEPKLVKPVVRHLFPDTWIWANGTADLEGRFKLLAKVPDTLTSYSLSAFSTSDVYGFGLSNQQTNLIIVKPISIKIHAPYSVVKGEIASIIVTLINYSEERTFAKVVLYNRYGEFDFVEPANCQRDEKRSRADQQIRDISIAGESSKRVSFLISPNKLGQVDLSVVASSDSSVDSVLHKLQVKPDGKTQHKNQAVLVNLNRSQRGKLIKNFTINIPSNAVLGSEKIFVSVVGDVLGPSLKNVKNLLRMPYGCGEQNMINLVPNIMIINYLEATGRSSPSTKSLALTNIVKGYQRQLKYKRSDGSFSAFGETDATGSVWLTAYVLKSFHQARSLIDIDERILAGAVEYLAGFSQEDGSIREVGMIHNQRLSSKSRPSTYLTAYCMIALLQSRQDLQRTQTNEVESPLDEMVERGLRYLEAQLDTIAASGDTYELSIISYALHLHNRTRAMEKAHEALWKRAIKSRGFIWWEAGKEASIDRKRSIQEPSPLSIETTALALLTLVRRGELELATPAVGWLVANQNSHGGFISTQDTVLAIEALSAFATANALTSGPSKLSVKLVYPASNVPHYHLSMEKYEVNPESAMLLHKTQLPAHTRWVAAEIVGSGSGTVQVSYQYNLLEPVIEKPAFHLRATINTGSTQSRMSFNVCLHYKAGEASNMAVLDVKLPSGYTLDTDSTRKLQDTEDILKKVEFFSHDSRVEIYFERLTRVKTCIPVKAFRNWKVSNNKPGSVGVYDYYNRKEAARVVLPPKIASSADICEPDTCSKGCRRRKKSTG